MKPVIHPRLQEDFRFLLGVMLQVAGITEEEFYATRAYPAPYWRAIVALSMQEKGYSLTEIGACVRRDHSTLSHYLVALRDVVDNPTFGTVRRIWDDFKSLKLALAENDAPRLMKIEKAARRFTGNHCLRRCASCYIREENCRYRQDERIFLAGARAQLDILRDTVGRLRELTSNCSLLCGREDMNETLADIERELSRAE